MANRTEVKTTAVLQAAGIPRKALAFTNLVVPHPGFERMGAAANQCCGLVRKAS